MCVRRFLLPISGLLILLLLTPPMSRYMAQRPSSSRIGSVPHYQVLRYAALDHRPLVGAYYMLKALNYFGGQTLAGYPDNIDYLGIYQAIEAALRLDPYNMDAYYFSQAILVWDLREIKLANSILEYGMRHRTWDPFLPFSAGFNYSYFLEDYKLAAHYYNRGAKISGSSLMTSLTSRFLYESGQTKLAIIYLQTLLPQLTNEALRQSSQRRLEALQAIDCIENALKKYQKMHGAELVPGDLDDLVSSGLLSSLPDDPYGGRFFLDEKGRVRTTSNLATHKRSRQ
jgi:hypothetical protein